VDLLACLCTDTATLQKSGWSQPPGSERVLYLRRADALAPSVARPRSARQPCPIVEAALLTLASDTQGGQLCPLLIRALPQMERLHDTAVRHTDGQCLALSGCDAAHLPLQGHRHAQWLPLDLDGDGRIEHVLVYAPMGLDAAAQQALCRIERTYGKDLPVIVVCLAGFGSLAAIRRQLRDQRGAHPGELGTATVWESRTPFLAPRHLKPAGKNSLVGQVHAECESRGLPAPVRVEEMQREWLVERRFLEFIRSRPEKAPPQTRPFGLRLTFEAPVSGPLCLGYASHFGLGVFCAQPAQSPEPLNAADE
jgi:CRISPR-associated protein Csb2